MSIWMIFLKVIQSSFLYELELNVFYGRNRTGSPWCFPGAHNKFSTNFFYRRLSCKTLQELRKALARETHSCKFLQDNPHLLELCKILLDNPAWCKTFKSQTKTVKFIDNDSKLRVQVYKTSQFEWLTSNKN